MRRANRRDANEAELVALARELGMTWQPTSGNEGALDGIVGAYGIDQRVEIKDGSKPPSARKLTPAEDETMQTWRGRRPVIWTCRADVLITRANLLADSAATFAGGKP